MPTIDTYTASGQSAPQQYYQRHISVPQSEDVGGIIERFGNKVQGIMTGLQDQQDTIDVAGMIGAHDSALKNIELEVNRDIADPSKRTEEFVKRSQEMQKSLNNNARNGRVQGLFQQYIGRHFPMQAVEYQAGNIKEQNQQQIATLDDHENEYTRLYAYAVKDTQRQTYRNVHLAEIAAAQRNKQINPIQAAERERRFLEKSDEEYMSVLGRQNPDKLQSMYESGEFKYVDPKKGQDMVFNSIRMQATLADKEVKRQEAEVKHFEDTVNRSFRDIMAAGDTVNARKFIDENRYKVDPKISDRWDKQYRDKALGVHDGNPDAERFFERLLGNRPVTGNPARDLQVALDIQKRLDRAYGNREVGYDFYDKHAMRLENSIAGLAGRQDARSDRNQVISDAHKARSDKEWQENATRALKTTTAFEKLDSASEESLTKFNDDYIRRVYDNGEDGHTVYRELMPIAITHAQSRMQSRLQYIGGETRDTPTTAALRDALSTGRLSRAEIDRRALLLQEKDAIIRHNGSLEGKLSEVQDKKPTSTTTKDRFNK